MIKLIDIKSHPLKIERRIPKRRDTAVKARFESDHSTLKREMED
jgi:hypothetical protein